MLLGLGLSEVLGRASERRLRGVRTILLLAGPCSVAKARCEDTRILAAEARVRQQSADLALTTVAKRADGGLVAG